MLVLVSGATRDVPRFDVGILVVPGAKNKPESLRPQPRRWAEDNGCFTGFNEAEYVAMLEAFRTAPGCLFATAPDVVGDAWRTMRQFYAWAPRIRAYGYPVALVAQDGLTVHETPWEDLDALFLGGTTEWKLGPQAAALAAAAKRRGKWLHMGRVNSRKRISSAMRLGCDSIDGSGFSKWPATLLPKATRWIRELKQQPSLLDG